MRVALFTECYHPIVNGVVVSVATFASALIRQGHDVHIFAPRYFGYCDREPNVHRLRTLSRPTWTMYPLTLPFSTNFYKSLLDREPPDIVHANHPFLTGGEARRVARRLTRPLVFTYHTIIRAYAHYVPFPQPIVRRLAVQISRNYANSASCVIVPTQATADLLRSYGVKTRLEIIPTGLDMHLIAAVPRQPIRVRYHIPEGVPLVCYSGRLAKEKSLDLLLKAFQQVRKSHPEAHLLLVGGGPWEAAIRECADVLGVADRVRFTGFLSRSDVFDCLAEAEVFAFPSLTDTQGLVVLEAMALGCPAVAVHSGAVVDIIREGVDGLIVSPTAEALADGLGRVLASSELRNQLASQAQQRAQEFTAEKMTHRLVAVYKSLL